MKKSNTSSFIVDIDNSSLKRLKDNYTVFQYQLPYHAKKLKGSYFALVHNWAKENISQPYYLHTYANKVYILLKKNNSPIKLVYDGDELTVEKFDDFKNISQIHIWLKVLLAQFIELKASFVSNANFYVHSELNKQQTWAKVLKIELSHDYKYKKEIVFNIKETATRLKKVSLDEYKQYHQRDIPFGLSFKNGKVIFKQLKKSLLKEYSANLFVKPRPITKNKHRTQITFHSITNGVEHQKSRSLIIQNFLSKFTEFLSGHDIIVSSKELNLIRVDKLKEKKGLGIKDFNVSLTDLRINKDLSIDDILPITEYYQNVIHFNNKKAEELKPSDSCLLVMDYNKDHFEKYFPEKKDPYLEFNENVDLNRIAKQGICINEWSFADEEALSKEGYFNYSGLQKHNLERNLSICLNQLFLKSILLTGDGRKLPLLNLMKNKLFVYKNKVLFLDSEVLKVKDIENVEMFCQLIELVTGRKDIMNILTKIHKYHNPFSNREAVLDYLFKLRFIISSDSVIELVDYPERAFYDDKEIGERLGSQYEKRSIDEFKAKGTSELALHYNEYLENKVEEISLSYYELKMKYGKGEEGFLKTIFYNNVNRKTYPDTPFRKFLKENKGLEIKGIKENKIFALHTGIWYDSENKQYFVGKSQSYGLQGQKKGFQMKKIIAHDGVFNMDTFFPLLNIDFIRYKELTVNPYPFKLIEMKIEIEENI